MQQVKRAAVSRKGLRLTIKIVLFCALGLLASLAVGEFGWQALKSWQAYSRAHEQRGFTAAADQFIKAVTRSCSSGLRPTMHCRPPARPMTA